MTSRPCRSPFLFRPASWIALGVFVSASLALAQTPAPTAAPAPATPAATPAAPPPPPTPSPTPPPIRQVRAEMRVLEWQLSNTTDFDFAVLFKGGPQSIIDAADLTLPASAPLSRAARVFLSGMDAGSGSFDAVIETLETVGKVSTVFNTSVTMTIPTPGATPAGPGFPAAYDATVTNSTELPYATSKSFGVTLATVTDYRKSGVKLEASAKSIRYDQFVDLQLRSTVSDLTGYMNVAKDAAGTEMRVPVLDTRMIQNHVLVKDRSIFISGLMKSTRETKRSQGIPWIAELPFFRWFMSNKATDSEVVELIFLVRPEIIEPIEGKS